MNPRYSKGARRRALFKLALVMLLGLGAGVALFVSTLRSPDQPAPSSSSKALLGALQGLTDNQGAQFDVARVRGQYVLIYFGFTFCPDACPTALYNLTLALQQLDPEAKRIQPIFVTVDPARDTPAQLGQYLAHFSERLIGLTGADESIRMTQQAFGVIAVEHRDDTLPGGYTMDHSNEFLLISPNGKLLMRLAADQSAEMLLEQLRGMTRAETV